MKFPLSWLHEWVRPQVDEAQFLHRLTMSGLEVEEVQRHGQGLDDVVVARIVGCEQHPNADRLRVCQVDDGSGVPLQIVCGAPNAREGLVAPLVRVGARLPDGSAIGKVKLRGVESTGMLCSGRELGLSTDHDGLLELATGLTPGQPLTATLGLPDLSIEIGLTPNRGDCLSIGGLAREIAAQYDLPQGGPVIDPQAATIPRQIEIRLSNPEACPRYCGRVIEGLRPGVASPAWMQQRLTRSGLRPISALVDVTNYVMLELGQPLHAFDADKVTGAINVRLAKAGEQLKLLDGREVDLDPDMLVIADDRAALALAGIMGGDSSKIVDGSSSVFLESAHFAPSAISGRARRLAMHTDASHRFERGVDAELPRLAIERATALLIEIAGGQAGPLVEAVETAALPKREPIVLRNARLQRVLGMQIEYPQVGAILGRLGLQVRAEADHWVATPPSARFDLQREEDLIEEVVRIFGYDNVPVRLPRGEIALRSPSEGVISDARLRQLIVARGYREAVNLSFASAELYGRYGQQGLAVKLANPLSADLALMRPALVPGLVESVLANLRRQLDRARMFELGRVFAQGQSESEHLAMVCCGSAQPEQWGSSPRPMDFFDLKADVEAVLSTMGRAQELRWEAAQDEFLHPGRAAALMLGNQRVGIMGALHPALQADLDAPTEVYVAELNLDRLRPRALSIARAISRFPQVRRDLAMIVDDQVSYAQVREAVLAEPIAELAELRLFDLYCGKGVPEGSKSFAIGLIFQHDSRTLGEQEVEAWVAAVRERLTQAVGAAWRG